jgi:hypothetical protein
MKMKIIILTGLVLLLLPSEAWLQSRKPKKSAVQTLAPGAGTDYSEV